MDIFFFQAKKKEAKKSPVTTTATVSRLTPQVAIINCSPLWLQTAHRAVCLTRRARNAFGVRENTNARFSTVGTDVLGCPNRIAGGETPPLQIEKYTLRPHQ